MNCLICNVKLSKNNKTDYCCKCKLKYFPLKINNSEHKCKQCGKVANYILYNQEYCCSVSKHKCSKVRELNKKTQKNINHKYIKFDNEDNILCEYGCQNFAKFKSKTGKLCCQDSVNKCPTKRQRNRETALVYTKDPKWRKAISERNKGKKFTKEHRENLGKSRRNSDKVKKVFLSKSFKTKHSASLKKHQQKKWGWREGKWCVYDTYASKLYPVDSTRRDPIEPRILQVKCIYCGKWFRPTALEVRNRCACLVNDPNISTSESHLYCSDECKGLCPTFKKIFYSDNDPNKRTYEVDPNLRKLVFERDEWKCQKCHSEYSLECHHIDPVALEPGFANDIDSCITLCKECHKFIHMNIEKCGYNEISKEKQKRKIGC